MASNSKDTIKGTFMSKPLAVSTLDEAATWLNETPGKSSWTGRGILNAVMKLQNPGIDKRKQVCYLRAAIPGIKFAFYKPTTNNGLIRDHEVQWKTCPLYDSNIEDLLYYDETMVIGGFGEHITNPDEEGFVFIEPSNYHPKMHEQGTQLTRSGDKPWLAEITIPIVVKLDRSIIRTHKVTYGMVRIIDSDLILLKKAITSVETTHSNNKNSTTYVESTPEQDTQDINDSWKSRALEIANQIALTRWKNGMREITARNICDAVASELAKDNSNYGNRGPRMGGTVRNEALRGWKFSPPDGISGTNK